jgi:hypothetical protein
MAATQPKSRKTARSRARIVPLSRAGRPVAVRWSKVSVAQRRIAAGHYDRDEVREKLVDEVLRELRRS